LVLLLAVLRLGLGLLLLLRVAGLVRLSVALALGRRVVKADEFRDVDLDGYRDATRSSNLTRRSACESNTKRLMCSTSASGSASRRRPLTASVLRAQWSQWYWLSPSRRSEATKPRSAEATSRAPCTTSEMSWNSSRRARRCPHRRHVTNAASEPRKGRVSS
jgi:hypothetical protein